MSKLSFHRGMAVFVREIKCKTRIGNKGGNAIREVNEERD